MYVAVARRRAGARSRSRASTRRTARSAAVVRCRPRAGRCARTRAPRGSSSTRSACARAVCSSSSSRSSGRRPRRRRRGTCRPPRRPSAPARRRPGCPAAHRAPSSRVASPNDVEYPANHQRSAGVSGSVISQIGLQGLCSPPCLHHQTCPCPSLLSRSPTALYSGRWTLRMGLRQHLRTGAARAMREPVRRTTGSPPRGCVRQASRRRKSPPRRTPRPHPDPAQLAHRTRDEHRADLVLHHAAGIDRPVAEVGRAPQSQALHVDGGAQLDAGRIGGSKHPRPIREAADLPQNEFVQTPGHVRLLNARRVIRRCPSSTRWQENAKCTGVSVVCTVVRSAVATRLSVRVGQDDQ